MTESKHAYFERRAAEEQQAADAASHPVARRSHLELAHRYAAAAAAVLGAPVVQFRRNGAASDDRSTV